MTSFGHLFISSGAAMLSAWREAFPDARCITPGALPGAVLPTSLIWLRIDHDIALDTQLAHVQAHSGACPVVVLSDLPGDDEALAALAMQARGYCNAHAGADVLTKVASVVSQGGLWIGETLMHRILSVQHHIRLPDTAARPDWRGVLTAREVEVAELAASGTRYKEIARQLMITERTVKMHMASILDKLGLRDRLQLALLASERQHTQEVAT